MSIPVADGFRMPAEWEHHSRCWMAWPCRPETFTNGIDAACAAYAEVAQAIAQFEPVAMVCNQADVAEVSLACGPGIEVLPMPISDSWVRDTGPTFVVGSGGQVAGVDWGFNAWGNNYPDHQFDAELAKRMLEHLGMPRYAAPLILEGGSIHVDGEGTLITTEECLLNPNRNPNLGKAEIEQHLRDYLGVRQIIWLGQGYEQDETDGHIDEIACFARPGLVLALTTDDTGDPNFKVFQDNLDRLKAARDAQGREIEVVTLRQPERRDHNNVRLTLSYTNFYIANRGIVMPAYEDAADEESFRTLRKVFSDREVIQVPALDIVKGGGGIHCITQQQPSGQ
jgi:agmatine deiminase